MPIGKSLFGWPLRNGPRSLEGTSGPRYRETGEVINGQLYIIE